MDIAVHKGKVDFVKALPSMLSHKKTDSEGPDPQIGV